MTVGTWALAALCAGALGAVGPHVIRLLPPSPDAEADAPSYQDLARAPRLSLWLAGGAVILVTIVAAAVPANLIPAWVLVCGVGIWLAYVDARTRLLPTRIVWPLFFAAVGLVLAEAWLAGDIGILGRALSAGVAAFGAYWVMWWLAGRWRSGGLGFGDVRFAAPLGLVLGSIGGWEAAVGLYLGILLGGIVGLVLKARGLHDSFALGPCMLLGAVLAPLAV